MTDATKVEDSSIQGYLYKKTRDNRWQKRWFETNGVYLTYYKSRKTEKLLAALSLPQVGDIKIMKPEDDAERLEGLFSLELNSRIYILRAKTTEEAALWVNMLNKLRVDGIRATLNPTSQLVSMETTSTTSDLSMSSQEKGKSEWIKSGKSCFGCC